MRSCRLPKLLFSLNIFFITLTLLFGLLTPNLANAATFTVTKTADTNGTCDPGDCSLREAVAAANANPGYDTIEFDIPTSDDGYQAGDDYFLITLTSLLDLTDDSGVFINGYSQSGAIRNTAAFGQTINAKLMIQIQTSTTFLQLSGDNNRIAGLNILRSNSWPFPMALASSSNNWIEGNFFGSDISGSTAVSGGKLFIDGTSSSNTIGTNGDGSGDPGERNLFLHNQSAVSNVHFGNKDGAILFRGAQSNNIVAGNYLGVDKTSRNCVGDGLNISSFGGSKTNHRYGTNFDGVSDSEEANISACFTATLTAGSLSLLQHYDGFVQGNYIGTNTHGDNLGAGNLNAGIRFASTTSSNMIVRGNTIMNKDGEGILISTNSTGITITQNSIFSTGRLPIDLGAGETELIGNGPTANDSGDTDTGPNDLMNYPVLKRVIQNKTHLLAIAELDFNPSEAPYTIEFFANDELHSSGHGGGQHYIGSVTTSTIGSDVELVVPLDEYTPTADQYIISTATNSNGSTSEFSSDPDTFIVDTTAPALSLNPILAATNASSFNLTGIATDSLTTITSVQYQINSTDGFWVACIPSSGSFSSASETFTCNIKIDLASGSHTIYVRATDAAGNHSVNTPANFIFDVSRPSRHNGMGGNEFSISSINGEYYGNNRTIRTSDRKPTIRFNRSLDNASGIDYYQIRLYDTDELGRKSGREYAWIDNIPDQGNSTRTREGHNIKYRGNGIIIEQTSGHKYELKEGTYFMRVRAFDKAGNSRTTGEVRIIIDEKYTQEYKEAMWEGITPAPEGTRLELTHIGNIPNAGAYGIFYYTAEQMDFKGKLDPTQPGVDVVVIVNGVEIGRSQTAVDGMYSIPASVSRGTNSVEIKIASSNSEQSSKKLTLVIDPTRQLFPSHLQ